MNFQRKNVGTLKEKLSKAARNSGKSYAEIGRIAGVHSSQVSRICNREFETLSANVVQVCKVLGLPVEGVALSEDEAIERQLQAAVLSVWDRTPEGARKLIRFLRDLAELQGGEAVNRPSAQKQSLSRDKSGQAGR